MTSVRSCNLMNAPNPVLFFHVDKRTRQSELCPHMRCGVEWGEVLVNARLLGSGWTEKPSAMDSG